MFHHLLTVLVRNGRANWAEKSSLSADEQSGLADARRLRDPLIRF